MAQQGYPPEPAGGPAPAPPPQVYPPPAGHVAYAPPSGQHGGLAPPPEMSMGGGGGYPPQPLGYTPPAYPGGPPGYPPVNPQGPGQAPPNAPGGPEFLFPPQFNALIEPGGNLGYPPVNDNTIGYPPPQYETVVAYSHDFRGLGGARAPQLVWRADGGSGVVEQQPGQGEGAPAPAPATNIGYAEVKRMSTHVECNYSAAFVTMSGTFSIPDTKGVTENQLTSLTFQLPQKHNSAVTNCKFWVGKGEKFQAFDVSTVAQSDAQQLAAKHPPPKDALMPVDDPAGSTFFIPVQGAKSGDDVVIEVTYYEKVESFGPNFEVLVPLGYEEKHMPLAEMNTRCPVTFAVNAGIRNFQTTGYQWPQGPNLGTVGYKLVSWSSSHQVWANQDNPTRLTGQVVSTVPWPAQPIQNAPRANDFVLLYTTVANEILGHVVYEKAPPDSYDARDTYALFLTPPTAAPSFQVFRRVIFLLDKSYSMSGEPFEQAREGLRRGLTMLNEGDEFSIHMFSHLLDEQFPRKEDETLFMRATPQNIAIAQEFLSKTQPDGGTDILGALQLAQVKMSMSRKEAQARGMFDFVFLLTDGAVSNEKDICNFATKEMGDVRFLTFGVGGFVNAAFLRMLATTGRGFCDISLNPAVLSDQMLHMMSKANAPLMTNITVEFPGEMYPRAVPDLYHGSSVVVGGKLQGALPPPGTIKVRGQLPGVVGPYEMTITPEGNPYVPVHRLFIKTMVDDLTAEAWLTDNEEIVKRVTDLSCNENMPSAYTTQIAHPAEPPEKEGKEKKDKDPKKGKKGFTAKHAAAAVAAGAVAGIGIYMLAESGAFNGLGNVGATLAGTPVIGSMVNLVGDGIGAIGNVAGDAMGQLATSPVKLSAVVPTAAAAFSSPARPFSTAFASHAVTAATRSAILAKVAWNRLRTSASNVATSLLTLATALAVAWKVVSVRVGTSWKVVSVRVGTSLAAAVIASVRHAASATPRAFLTSSAKFWGPFFRV
eukprot:CAMPEP_0182917680 /NCGR_PEP_ID=MMETSP0105_2-20130417/1651_1 /TAXON_ID=81532 ORGANISM="Acanthoeca-like sp., Strain 10tr" /NCGR_SAMPLE_ID=MMETSP0105_2 /ASSEMBLY_ACC=CAM_ASM_000205 /LENGTH=987 /DNA_ID=CAMNT_0025054695 /DNA_START=40 /DNA_END=3004 /DNA_ORIENTATION=-